MNISLARKSINIVMEDRRTAVKNLKAERKRLTTTDDLLFYVEEAQTVVQGVSQHIQQQAHDQIANVVSRCLETVFEDDYGFRILFEKKRGRTQAQLIILKGKNEITDPLNEDSGGVVDVAAFALRVACLILHKPKLRPVLVLDEPFKFVSRTYRANVRALLDALAGDFGIQIIMVTHEEEYTLGKIIKL